MADAEPAADGCACTQDRDFQLGMEVDLSAVCLSLIASFVVIPWLVEMSRLKQCSPECLACFFYIRNTS